MEYLSQSVVYLLALFCAFFKCVKEDSAGKIVRTKLGLPVPTVAGVVISILLTMSFLVSLKIASSKDSVEAEAKNKLERITKQLDTLSNDKQGLKSAVQKLNSVIALKSILEEPVKQISKQPVIKREGSNKIKPATRDMHPEMNKGTEAGVKKNVVTEQSTGKITVRNSYSGEISLWVDGDRFDLKTNEVISIKVQRYGSNLQLYSCGWLSWQTSLGQAPGCRLISYDVLPGQDWAVKEIQPAPRIIMQLNK